MAERYFQHTFPNGLTLLAEKMPGMQSAAMTLLVPAGSATDPVDRLGLGDGPVRPGPARRRHARQPAADRLPRQPRPPALQQRRRPPHPLRLRGAGRAGDARGWRSTPTSSAGRTCPRPGFEAARDLALQALAGIEDEPRQKLLIKLREWHLPSPYGRKLDGAEGPPGEADVDLCQGRPRPALSREGRDPLASRATSTSTQVKRRGRAHFGDWNGSRRAAAGDACRRRATSTTSTRRASRRTSASPSRSIPETDPDYYTLRLAIEVLSGGMSGRLFTEVREKRGLCYSVWAGYSSLKGQGSILGYAGTSNDRAQATLDCFIAELHRLAKASPRPSSTAPRPA